ncbi:39S ribosomal protein L23-like protein [Leptotrombidium deliense]|uniref:Large ribosomal subunit protein uL23m n=1 Tax=Leptotrombidium deliense TaxID=299467 RepID=A0A443SEA9_9ACAR|nr:39S ribosomal protein L23-like protein [Leptotrombidium deliense]
MSTRYYPRYVRGNPQLRIFLPNFWIKLIKNDVKSPPNHVTFKVPLTMSDHDVRNYLEKIYKIPVVHLKTEARCGPLDVAKGQQYMVKGEDYRIAFVTMPKDVKFTFPDLFPAEKVDEPLSDYKHMKKMIEKSTNEAERRNVDRKDVPGWF